MHRRRITEVAVVDARRAIGVGSELELAVDYRRLHFFDPTTSLALADVPAAAAPQPV